MVKVTLGEPVELGMTVSKFSALPLGKVTFKVTNKGILTHDFKVCAKATETSSANTCNGIGTKKLTMGQSATLVVPFKANGKYEYLSTLPGQAAAGMKGLLGIGVKVPASPGGSTAGGGTTGTTGHGGSTTGGGGSGTPAPETLVGDPNNGASIWNQAGCASCHTMRAAGATGNVGPNLDNSKPGQQTVIQFVTNGTGVMPSFSGRFSASQMQDLAAYVYRSTH